MLPNSMLGSDFLYANRSLRSSSILESNSKDFFDTTQPLRSSSILVSTCQIFLYDRDDFRCFLLLEPILLYTRIEL